MLYKSNKIYKADRKMKIDINICLPNNGITAVSCKLLYKLKNFLYDFKEVTLALATNFSKPHIFETWRKLKCHEIRKIPYLYRI